MWNVVEILENSFNYIKGFDGRPLLFTEKRFADRMCHELTEANKNTKYLVVEYINGQAY